MIEQDIQELKETIEMIQEEMKENPKLVQGIVAHLSFGDFVVMREEQYVEIVSHLNNVNLKGNAIEIVDGEE